MKLLGITEKALWVFEGSFQVPQKRLFGFSSEAFRYHRKGFLGFRVKLLVITAKALWVFEGNF
jgi:hypothetical protein